MATVHIVLMEMVLFESMSIRLVSLFLLLEYVALIRGFLCVLRSLELYWNVATAFCTDQLALLPLGYTPITLDIIVLVALKLSFCPFILFKSVWANRAKNSS